MNVEDEIARLSTRLDRLEKQFAEIRSWSADTDQDVDYDREQLANARRDIEFTSGKVQQEFNKVDERISRVETGVATIYGFMEKLNDAIKESKRTNNLAPLLNVEPLSLPSGLESNDRN